MVMIWPSKVADCRFVTDERLYGVECRQKKRCETERRGGRAKRRMDGPGPGPGPRGGGSGGSGGSGSEKWESGKVGRWKRWEKPMLEFGVGDGKVANGQICVYVHRSGSCG